jgi:small subunit ribosomal protein S20
MPVTKTAKRALRQNVRRNKQNLGKKITLKAMEKQINRLLQKKDIQGARALLPSYYKALDKAAKTGIIKKNKAGRVKSRTTVLVNKKAK